MFLISSGADAELGCSTPLMEAAQEGHLELVKYLVNSSEYFYFCLCNGIFKKKWFGYLNFINEFIIVHSCSTVLRKK